MCGWIKSVRKTKHTNKPKTAATMVWLDQNAPTNM
jgi:hypothetical protein